MPTKISALTAASQIDGSELIPIVQGGTSKKLPLSALIGVPGTYRRRHVPAIADFTSGWLNQGSSTVQQGVDGLILSFQAVPQGTGTRVLAMPLPTGPHCVDILFDELFLHQNYVGAGLCWVNGATSQVDAMIHTRNVSNSTSTEGLNRIIYTDVTQNGAYPSTGEFFAPYDGESHWFRFESDGTTTRSVSVSRDGSNWIEIVSCAFNAEIGVPTEIGVIAQCTDFGAQNTIPVVIVVKNLSVKATAADQAADVVII